MNREKAADLLDNLVGMIEDNQSNDYDEALKLAIKALEQPEPPWIPVSERLPESNPEDLEYPTVIACCEDGEVMTACYYESTKEWGTGENYDKKINPVVWMQLPSPYREDGGE